MEKTMLAVKYYSKLTVHWSLWVQILPTMTKRKKRSSLDLHDLSSWRSLIPVLVVKRSKATVWNANASQVPPPPPSKKKTFHQAFLAVCHYQHLFLSGGGTESKVTCRKKTTTTQRTKQVLNMDLRTMSQCTYNVFHNNWRSPHYLYRSKGCCTLRVGCQYVIKPKGGTS